MTVWYRRRISWFSRSLIYTNNNLLFFYIFFVADETLDRRRRRRRRLSTRPSSKQNVTRVTRYMRLRGRRLTRVYRFPLTNRARSKITLLRMSIVVFRSKSEFKHKSNEIYREDYFRRLYGMFFEKMFEQLNHNCDSFCFFE